jgi:hypothetical protein
MAKNKSASMSCSQNPSQVEAGPNGNVSLSRHLLSREFGVISSVKILFMNANNCETERKKQDFNMK